MIQHKAFRVQDLVKVDTPSLDSTLTSMLAHIVRCGGNKEKLTLIREALGEIDQFLVECLMEQSQQVN